MPRDNLVGLIEPMAGSAGNFLLALLGFLTIGR
jgi:hypothetical protein